MRENEELIRLGAYRSGSDPAVDEAIAANSAINQFLRQGVDDHTVFEDTAKRLAVLASTTHAAKVKKKASRERGPVPMGGRSR